MPIVYDSAFVFCLIELARFLYQTFVITSCWYSIQNRFCGIALLLASTFAHCGNGILLYSISEYVPILPASDFSFSLRSRETVSAMLKTVVFLFTFLCSFAITHSTICPDGISMCRDGQTCCILTSGKYGCCPLPSAVCCEDRLHCCPSGYSCNLKRLTCDNGGNKIPMLKLKAGRPALKPVIAANSKTLGNVFCPDHKSQCPDAFTCCTGQHGDWECCPMPNATCCADHQHCCPHGTTCDLKTKSCIQRVGKEIPIPWKAKVKASKVPTNSVICPDQKSYCPTGYTCCLLSSGMYGCCPYQNAVCCSDHIHCCPSGMICDIYHTTCKPRADTLLLTIPFHDFSFSKLKKPLVTCPDRSSCPGQESCCELSSGGYGCCPYEEAVCCSDGKHCCPHGTTCDVAAGTCKRQKDGRNFPMSLSKVRKAMVKCPDGSSCPGQESCCELSSGGYGCCPYEEAVCCSDGKHCCPHGTTCDVAAGTCKHQTDTEEFPMALSKVTKAMVKCPDGSACPGQETCCKLSSGGYGCCPYEEAVCCSDKKHCCPHGTTCDVAAGTCKRQKDGRNFPMSLSKVRKAMVKCPDGSACPGQETCCKLSSGGYGCCPYEEAVCCSDGKHCCPHGTTCDVAAGTCKPQTDGKKFPMSPLKVRKAMLKCPDGSSCPGQESCCELSSGGYGCCPYEEAVCCSDGKHCCPHGTTCDVAAGTCKRQKDGRNFPMSLSKVRKTMVKCPDGSSCPGQESCCELSSGGYGCCPYEEAVCCSDGKHCCPHGTTCDVAAGTCKRQTDNEEFPMSLSKVTKAMVKCPDRSACPGQETCCKLSSGGYGCCPYEEAVCCSDKKHCCPHGTTCDVAAGTCKHQKDGRNFPMSLSKVRKTMVKCPDGSSCPGQESCCELSSGGYGCCPYEEAVCCSDGKHCCPHGTTCDVAAGTCKRQTDTEEFPMSLSKVTKAMVKCPDGSACPGQETCCKLSSGGYGCCPYEEAVCCSDKKHCCPHGTTCDVAAGTCKRQKDGRKFPVSLSNVRKAMVKCPDGSACPGQETCCKLSSGGYGCCPYEEAVCCSDGKHCCPHGTTCDVAAGTCKPQTDGKKFPMSQLKVRKAMVKCPDGSSCPGQESCCELSSGGYGCCPYEEAVCCSDKKHCCPHGTTCDVAAGTCKRQKDGRNFPMSLSKVRKAMVKCPDGSACPGQETCCKLSTGGYGCCTYEEAVCCSDGKHCCPHGTTCDVAAGTCKPQTDGKKFPMSPLKLRKAMVKCPDGSSCPGQESCCELSSGGYGCCPYEEAVCCSDGKHCCPHGTTCDVAAGTCKHQKDGRNFPMSLSKVRKAMVKCSDGSSCPGQETCCKLSSAGYGCCPYEEAVCCSDGKHCCPHGTTCDVAAGTCKRQKDGRNFPMSLSKVRKAMVKCPDGSACPGQETCCKLSTGGYGCCTYEEAVCCSDGKHCCPHGTTCDVAAGTCKPQTDGKKFPMSPLKVRKAMVKCPDGSSCPGQESCCELSSGGYGCCPYEEAVCCSDKKHCCPHGTTCDVAAGTCKRQKDGRNFPMSLSKVRKTMVKCPDGSSCPGQESCCELSSGGCGCCPYEEAVCCSDGKHCCPHGTTCDVAAGTCKHQTDTEEFPMSLSKVTKAMVKCPDGSACPGQETCCKLSSGGYGCCPYEEAVCCSDKKHCCPHGTTCDVAAGTCKRQKDGRKFPVSLSNVRKAMVKCPDGSACPGQETCCKLSSGGYGCCPYEEAVCCSDKKHCCPHGTTCDVAAGTCKRQKDGRNFPMSLSKVRKAMVKCPDGSSCPGQESCCELSSGGYGCCPYEEAVCCSDGKHCCPHGTTCDVAAGTCKHQKDGRNFPMSLSKVRKTMVKCPDGSSCPGQESCCELSSGGYGCCPYEEAVCCSDGKHCCPHGTTCDVAAGTCKPQVIAILHNSHNEADFGDIICPDGISACPSGDTCCPMGSGNYGCCPLPHAVCCSDRKHCCPKGTTCDLSSETCISEKDYFPMRKKVASFRFAQKGSVSVHDSWMKSTHNTVVCPGGKTKCRDGSTCCLIDAARYGCCPLKNAVCCSDRQHCCPNGYTCGPYGKFICIKLYSLKIIDHKVVRN